MVEMSALDILSFCLHLCRELFWQTRVLAVDHYGSRYVKNNYVPQAKNIFFSLHTFLLIVAKHS